MANNKNLAQDSKATQFKKGVSGNPKGKPKGTIDLKTRIKNLLEGKTKLPKKIQEMVDSKLGIKDGKLIDAMVLSQTMLAMKTKQAGSTRACELLFDRGYGKPKEDEVDTTIRIVWGDDDKDD